MSRNALHIDVADDRTTRRRTKRSIKLPGRPVQFADTDPHAIARELRAKSALGAKERKIGDN